MLSGDHFSSVRQEISSRLRPSHRPCPERHLFGAARRCTLSEVWIMILTGWDRKLSARILAVGWLGLQLCHPLLVSEWAFFLRQVFCDPETVPGTHPIVSGAMAGWDPELFADERREAVEEGPLVWGPLGATWKVQELGARQTHRNMWKVQDIWKYRPICDLETMVIFHPVWSTVSKEFAKMISQYESTGQMKRGNTCRNRFVWSGAGLTVGYSTMKHVFWVPLG